MTTVAMRGINPRMAGAASGVFNTTRQVGSVIGTAGVGALLQNRLATDLTSQARQQTASLPAPVRDKIISGFQGAARGGLEVGSGHRLTGLGAQIFSHGFVDAMRPTMLVPIVILLIAAASCLLIRGGPVPSADQGAGARAEVAGEPTTAVS
jgi:hypothetical protein